MRYIPKSKIESLREKICEEYAQKSSPFNRRVDYDEENPDFIIRNEFSRDRDRILFSKAFRRLEHKAQVYSHEKGDHFRTRLTHSIEVSQIARSISRNLGLDEDLTEAIALGHDIGHTPFGHQGEDVLDDIMRGKDDLGGILKYKIDYRGFKHNFNSLKTIDILEKKYENFKGLNATWQVLEGILKHTKIRKNGIGWDLNRFIQCSNYINDFMVFEHSVTLEGQIVAIADEIAQRQHDLDDGFRDKDLKLDENEIINYIHINIGHIIAKTEDDFLNLMNFDESYYPKFNKFVETTTPADILDKYKEIESIAKLIPKNKAIDYDLWDKIVLTRYVIDYVISEDIEVKLLKDLEIKIKSHAKKLELLDKQIIDESKKKGFDFNSLKIKESNNNYLWYSLIRDILDYFIKDVTVNSLKNIEKLENSDKNEKRNHMRIVLFNRKQKNCKKLDLLPLSNKKKYWNKRKYFTSQLISFSDSGEKLSDMLENYINYQIINSYNVNRFDAKASYLLKQLFKAYYNNPRQMPKETLDKLSQRIKENIQNLGNKSILIPDQSKNQKENELISINKINFRTGHPKNIDFLIRLLKLENTENELESIFEDSYLMKLTLDDKFMDVINELKNKIEEKGYYKFDGFKSNISILELVLQNISKINERDLNLELNEDNKVRIRFIKLILENNYTYLSLICDHIAGMTDNYAKNEYKKLYLV